MDRDTAYDPSHSTWWLNGLDRVDSIVLFIARIVASHRYQQTLARITTVEAAQAALESATKWSHNHLAYARRHCLLSELPKPVVRREIMPLAA